jgi:hypothetical protein
VTADYPYIQKPLDTITPIRAVMGGDLGAVVVPSCLASDSRDCVRLVVWLLGLLLGHEPSLCGVVVFDELAFKIDHNFVDGAGE